MRLAVFLNGTNCFLRREEEPSQEGQLARMGFYTTCFVDAPSQHEGLHRAVAIVEERLRQVAVNKPGQPWRISIVEIREGADQSAEADSHTGFAWYPEEDGTEN